MGASRAIEAVGGPHNIAAWLNRTQGLMTSVEQMLGQELEEGDGECCAWSAS